MASQDWGTILLDAIVETAVGRLLDIGKKAAAVASTLASFFPVPGPDADARFFSALLDFANSLDLFGLFVFEVASKTVSRLPIPREWRNHVIRADVAAIVTLDSLANALWDTSQTWDQPTRQVRTAAWIHRWEYLVKQGWDLYLEKYGAVALRWIRKAVTFAPIKIAETALTVLDLTFKVFSAVAGIIIAVYLLRRMQKQYEQAFLQQRTARKRVRLRQGGSIYRREPGGSKP